MMIETFHFPVGAKENVNLDCSRTRLDIFPVQPIIDPTCDLKGVPILVHNQYFTVFNI